MNFLYCGKLTLCLPSTSNSKINKLSHLFLFFNSSFERSGINPDTPRNLAKAVTVD